ncbi:hypothetical protein [Oleiagrimonas sp. MCCC 1A03011]|uniref:hypothetical protein n=1 Tax=Oleiagrimonas sp. MCCC 1A03011 TaxID=1926883 RepID=UPI000DC32765|nr:hypothetical protein [Oleiagrimonas sp. MCCC 1A03011]RAP56211.1 hypothetical protein BTJ49_14235 [Oleiagrimonas sp. MCCC 1A03011]
MTERASWFTARQSDGTDMAPELLRFGETIGLERVARGRYSLLLLLGLFGGAQSRTQNPAKIVREIEVLEGLREASNLKSEAQFDRVPLKGLWHKHYLQDGLSSMARNLRKGMYRNGLPWLEQQVAAAEASGEERFLSAEDCARIAHDAVVSNWERLVQDSALTGEWLIYAKHQGKNYYLCLGEHTAGDAVLRQQINTVCLQEFPFLSQILHPLAK